MLGECSLAAAALGDSSPEPCVSRETAAWLHEPSDDETSLISEPLRVLISSSRGEGHVQAGGAPGGGLLLELAAECENQDCPASLPLPLPLGFVVVPSC